MTSTHGKDEKPVRGTFRFLNVKVGTAHHRSIEIQTGLVLNVTDLPGNTTEEDMRARMLADGFIEVDRDGKPIDALENVLRNETALGILKDAAQKLKSIGIEAFNQPLVSPVDNAVGWFLIVAKDHADVNCLRALLTAGCDICDADHTEYTRALDMISTMEN